MSGKSQHDRVANLEKGSGSGLPIVFQRLETTPSEQAIDEAVEIGRLAAADAAILRGEADANGRQIMEVVICFVESARKFDETGEPIS